MQRHALILLFVLSPLAACAMEVEEQQSFSCYSWRDYVPAWFVSNKVLTPLQEAQVNRDKFEAQLQLGWSFQTIMPLTSGLFSRFRIESNPVEFFKYCYHQKLHKELMDFSIKLSDLDQTACLNNMCKEARIDGYSALGAAIIAKDVVKITYKGVNVRVYKTTKKRDFIRQLIDRDFTLTEKDRTLVALELYDGLTIGQKETMILFLQNHQEGGLEMLPHDVKRHIVGYLIDVFKKPKWLYRLIK